MLQAGKYHNLEIKRITSIGAYVDDGKDGILLPKRFTPKGVGVGDIIQVFLYHDGEGRLIATTQEPKAIVGDITRMKVVSTSSHGAFLDWGLMKDLFVPHSKQITPMRVGGEYLVKLYNDNRNGRVVATSKLDEFLSNDTLTVKEGENVNIIAWRETDLGFVVIINNMHTGLIHHSDVFRLIEPGDHFSGYIKRILPGNKIDVLAGKPGYARISDEATRILDYLQQNNGYMPFSDKSSPEEIYENFQMSKKAFKMALGKLYKERLIQFTQTGTQLVN